MSNPDVKVETPQAISTIITFAFLNPLLWKQLAVVSPYLSDDHAAWERLIRLARQVGARLAVFTRESGPDVHASALHLLRSAGARILIHSQLHAKVYLLTSEYPDSSAAYVGSANFTRKGLTENIEAGLFIRGGNEFSDRLLAKLQLYVANLEGKCKQLTAHHEGGIDAK